MLQNINDTVSRKNFNIKSLLITIAVCVISFILGMLCIYAVNSSAQKSALKNQPRLFVTVQDAIKYYSYGGDIKKAENYIFKGITLRGNLDAVELLFEEAVRLAPSRTDLQYSLASTQVLKGDYDRAFDTYSALNRYDPYALDAVILSSFYSKALGMDDQYNFLIDKAYAISKEQTDLYIKTVENADKIILSELKVKPEKYPYRNGAIVVLGYALADDGEPQDTLIQRLEKALALFRLNRTSKIIVSGGMAHGGVTESYVMKEWLIANSVPQSSIIIEDQSKDTVGNAINSAAILKNGDFKNVTIVTSASHIRRALALFNEACDKIQYSPTFDNLVYLDYSSIEEASKIPNKERIIIYRDLFRTAGIWAYPCIQN